MAAVLVILILGVVIGLLIYWRIDLKRHPFRACRRCHGTGKTRVLAIQWGCRCCKGSGKHLRLGVMLTAKNPKAKTS